MKLMREMFGAQSVRWSADLKEEKIEVCVDSSTAIVDANTLVSGCGQYAVCGCGQHALGGCGKFLSLTLHTRYECLTELKSNEAHECASIGKCSCLCNGSVLSTQHVECPDESLHHLVQAATKRLHSALQAAAN